jgi:hypothetical protein
MNTIDQIIYRAGNGSTGILNQAATSIRDQAESGRWLRQPPELRRALAQHGMLVPAERVGLISRMVDPRAGV